MRSDKRKRPKGYSLGVFMLAMLVLFVALLAGPIFPTPAQAGVVTSGGQIVATEEGPAFEGNPVAIATDFGQFVLPLQLLDVGSLYAPGEGRGFVGFQTTYWRNGKFLSAFGVAPVLGQSNNVPYLAIERKVNPRLLDDAATNLRLGAFIGLPKRAISGEKRKPLIGILFSVSIT